MIATRPVSRRRRYRRIDWLVLRWQARLDARWADRVLPWIVAAVLFVPSAPVIQPGTSGQTSSVRRHWVLTCQALDLKVQGSI